MVAELRAAIVSGRYEPNARLVERRLAAELGVSHIPIREALARLADEGLVEHRPRRGARVAALTPEDIVELSSLRVLLEQFVVERVQQRLTPAREAELRKTLSSMAQAAKRKDVGRVFALDERFHEQLWAQAEHGMLLELATQLRRRINAFLRAATAALDPDELAEHARSHDVLLDAIASGDPDVARDAMADHIETATARVLRTHEAHEPRRRDVSRSAARR